MGLSVLIILVERTSREVLIFMLRIHHLRSSAIAYKLLAMFSPRAILIATVITSDRDLVLGPRILSLNFHKET